VFEGQWVFVHVRRIRIATDGEIIVVLEGRRDVGPAADRESAEREVVSRLLRHAGGKEIAPALTHRFALWIGQTHGIRDQSVGDVVAHFMKGDERLVIAGAAWLRIPVTS